MGLYRYYFEYSPILKMRVMLFFFYYGDIKNGIFFCKFALKFEEKINAI